MSLVYFINSSHQSVRLLLHVVARQQLSKDIVATNTHATLEEILDASFSVQSVDMSVYPHIISRQWLSKYFSMTRNTHATTEELLDVFCR
jgi:hypothetical protein